MELVCGSPQRVCVWGRVCRAAAAGGCGVPGPETSRLRSDDPFSLVFLEFLQEKGCTKGPCTSPGGVLPLQSLHTGLVLPRGAKPVRP